jgi:hypothetical protein
VAERPTILTAADERFARTLRQMLASIERHALETSFSVIVVDLGMTERSRSIVERRFRWCRLERFDFGAYPAHVRMLANFAWKPCVIREVAQRTAGPILWFDSATLFHGSLEVMLRGIARDGAFSLAGQTALGRCCDPRTLAMLGTDPADLDEPYRAGGVLGFDPARPAIRDLLERWHACALNPECIAPAGHDRAMHRFDQAVLTALLCAERRTSGLRIDRAEIDISSTDPVGWVSTRNKVPAWMPMVLDAPVRAFYRAWKRADRTVLRLKERFREASYRRASPDSEHR